MNKKILTFFTFLFIFLSLAFYLGACTTDSDIQPTHNCEFTEKVTQSYYNAQPATCQNKATYFYSCTCGKKGTETFEYGSTVNHKFGNYTYENNTLTGYCIYGCGNKEENFQPEEPVPTPVCDVTFTIGKSENP